jgi:hypothetical protein
MSTKNNFFSKGFFLFFFFEGTFSSIFKDKKKVKSHKTAEITSFFPFLLDDGKI